MLGPINRLRWWSTGNLPISIDHCCFFPCCILQLATIAGLTDDVRLVLQRTAPVTKTVASDVHTILTLNDVTSRLSLECSFEIILTDDPVCLSLPG